MIQKIQMLHKETVWATPNGDMVRLGTLTSNSPMLDEIGPTEKPIRPTELPGPINTLVSAHGSGQPTITTTQHSALFRPKSSLPWERSLMTSHVFWLFLTYLPTLSYSITSLFWGYLGPPYLP